MKSIKALNTNSSESLTARFNLSFGLMAAIWLLGFIGHFTPLQEWPALVLYVVGGIGIVVWRGKSFGEWQPMYLSGGDLKTSLKWGGMAGGLLFALDLINTVIYYKAGNPPMANMEFLLVNGSLLYGFPLLIVAEELLWRGIMFSALIERGVNKHLTVILTTIFYVVNHFAVAPVSMYERALMGMMAVPIGLFGGYLVLKTRNVWGSVLVHMITMVSMVLDIFVIPQLVR